ncbi:MAG: hypothetical protein ABJ246_11280, partial [Paracoccaceae bacterium]
DLDGDTITDFEIATVADEGDAITVQGRRFDDGHLTVSYTGGNTVLTIDTDRDGVDDTVITLSGTISAEFLTITDGVNTTIKAYPVVSVRSDWC